MATRAQIAGLLLLAGLLPAPLPAPPAHASEASAKAAAHARGAKPAPRRKSLVRKLPPGIREDYQKYCYNIADAARDARYAHQAAKLKELEERLSGLLARLERKRAEYEKWVLRRKAIIDRMTSGMIGVYEKMDPEAAAAQVAQMEYAVAVALLTGLSAEKASAILNEMDPKKAGRLVNVIVGAVANGESEREAER